MGFTFHLILRIVLFQWIRVIFANNTCPPCWQFPVSVRLRVASQLGLGAGAIGGALGDPYESPAEDGAGTGAGAGTIFGVLPDPDIPYVGTTGALGDPYESWFPPAAIAGALGEP